MRQAAAWLVVIALLAVAYLLGRDYVRRHPQNVPWTRLDLRHPVGMFTGRKLAALHKEPALCRALLAAAGSSFQAAPPRQQGSQCGYTNGMRLTGPSDGLRFSPAGVVTSCPVAAAMVIYDRQVLEPAALRHFGARIAAVDHAGSYSCRRLYGRSEGSYSEHATANALDITGFRLSDGTRISVLRNWRDPGPKALFLRDVRDGACKLFATVLSPDYNQAHADHLHLDQAKRAVSGWSACR